MAIINYQNKHKRHILLNPNAEDQTHQTHYYIHINIHQDLNLLHQLLQIME